MTTDFIDNLQNEFIEKYEGKNYELEKACNEEAEKMRDYNGRQILELLQNVDDACDKSASVTIAYKNSILEVGNTGTSFNKETIERLCHGGVSNKSSEKIGNKGTGFRSLLNNAEWIEVHSGDFSIRFSDVYAKQLFNQHKNSEIIRKQIENWNKDYPLCFPVMNFPQKINKAVSKFDTLIRVKIKNTNLKTEASIENQLQQPFYKALLFLPHINEIIVETDDGKKIYKKEEENNKNRIYNGNTIEDYFLFRKQTIIENKKAELIIAVPENPEYDFSKETLYCYFPIRNFGTPVHALIHAPFKTNAARDDVPDDDKQINVKIFKEIILFIKETAEKLACSDYPDDIAIRMATMFDKNKFWNNNLKEEYFKTLVSAKILPTVNNEFISINDNPKILDGNFPKEFKGDKFNDLLIRELGNESRHFIEKLINNRRFTIRDPFKLSILDDPLKFEANDLIKRINALSGNWDTATQVRVFLWWSQHYKDNVAIPDLLADTGGNRIKKFPEMKVFLPADNEIPDLLKKLHWAKLCILDKSLYSELIRQIKEKDAEGWEKVKKDYQSNSSDKRILSSYSKGNLAVEFTEQSSTEQVLETINRQIDTTEKSASFFTCIFDTYRENKELPEIDLKLPDINNEIKSKTKLYFGKEYENPLADKLFAGTDFSPLIPLSELYNGDLTDKKEELIYFLKEYGISEYPKIFDEDLSRKNDFKNFIFKTYKFENKIKNINYIHSKSIQNYNDLISSLTMHEIKEWIFKDNTLKSLLDSSEKESKAWQQQNWRPEYFPSNAYIKYVLNTTKWIEIDGKKYSPSEIVLYEELGDKIEGIYGISSEKLEKILWNDITNELDFVESLASFPDDIIEKMLKILPDIQNSEKISKRLYKDLIKDKPNKQPEYNPEGLRVLAKDGKFYPNTDIKYADKKVPNIKGRECKFIDIPEKQNKETIEKWLGVKPYKSELKMETPPVLHKNAESKEITDEINDIKIAILSTINKNKENIRKINSMNIFLCKNIKVNDIEQNNSIYDLDDYLFIEDVKNKFYLKVPDFENVSELRQKYDFQLAVIDIFKQALTLELNQGDLESLIVKNHEDKIKKIGQDEWEENRNRLLDLKVVNQQFYVFFKENNLEENLYKEISSIDFLSSLSLTDSEKTIKALKYVSKDINDLKGSSDIEIDIRPYWVEQTKQTINNKWNEYEKRLYSYAENKGLEAQKLFLSKKNELRNYLPGKDVFQNSVYENIENVLIKNFQELKTTPVNFDIDEKYKKNALYIKTSAHISDDEFDDFIQRNSYYNSLLYFTIHEEIIHDIKKYKNELENNKKEDTNTSDNLKDMETHTVTRSFEARVKEKQTGRRRKESAISFELSDKQKKKAGKEAEKIAYLELKKTYPDLIWHSENSENPADRNNEPPHNIVCDMWNRGEINTYFEIKSATNEFIMSINEYNSMKENHENYIIILVDITKKEISMHKFNEIDHYKKINDYKFEFDIKK